LGSNGLSSARMPAMRTAKPSVSRRSGAATLPASRPWALYEETGEVEKGIATSRNALAADEAEGGRTGPPHTPWAFSSSNPRSWNLAPG
jgi:hypothetical protein